MSKTASIAVTSTMHCQNSVKKGALQDSSQSSSGREDNRRTTGHSKLPPVISVRVKVGGDHHSVGELPAGETLLSLLGVRGARVLYEYLKASSNYESNCAAPDNSMI